MQIKKIKISTAIIPKNRTLQQSEAEIIFREFYSNHHLTDCLEILEEQGFCGEAAIFLLSLLIWVGGEA
jgi:hypothetical protein